MEIRRYCGKEKLPEGERLWRKLARAVGFDGRVEVYGWGVKGEPGREQRRAYRAGDRATVADFSPGVIRVWLDCQCSATDFYERDENTRSWVLESFAHELGHHRQYVLGRERWGTYAERSATRYGRMLLRSVKGVNP